MQTRVTFYVKTSANGFVKLGSTKTILDCRKPGVVEKVAKELGVDGWNCHELNGKMIDGGPGIKSDDIIYFVKNDRSKSMSLKYQTTVDMDTVVVPVVVGYSYVVPVVGDEVIDEEDEAEMADMLTDDSEVDYVAEEAPSETDSVSYDFDILSKMKKQELLNILGDDGDGRLSKSELISIILKK